MKLSQYKLSELSGVPRTTLVRIEQGQVEPRISTLRRIATALKIEVKNLIG